MGLAQRDLGYHTYADYCSWPDDVRYELIDGVAYAMGPAPLRVHQKVLMEIGRQVANAIDGKPCEAYLAPFDVRLPKSDEADDLVDTVVQPDLVVIAIAPNSTTRAVAVRRTGWWRRSLPVPPGMTIS